MLNPYPYVETRGFPDIPEGGIGNDAIRYIECFMASCEHVVLAVIVALSSDLILG